MNLNPVTLKKLKRFKSIKRGFYSFVIFTALVVLSLLAELLVNSRALMVSYQGQLHFPTYGDVIPGQHFGRVQAGAAVLGLNLHQVDTLHSKQRGLRAWHT